MTVPEALAAGGLNTHSSGAGDLSRKAGALMVKHVVLFSFNYPLDSDEVRELNSNFDKLPSLIPEVVSYDAGSNMSSENLGQGYDMCYVLDFNNEADRDAYLVHPHHQEFVKKAKPLLKDVCVFDFVPGKV